MEKHKSSFTLKRSNFFFVKKKPAMSSASNCPELLFLPVRLLSTKVPPNPPRSDAKPVVDQ